MQHPYRAKIIVDAEIFAGIAPNYNAEIVEFILTRLSSPFFVRALSVKVEYPEDDDSNSVLVM